MGQSITLASSAAPANQNITLSASGYSGTGQVTYQVTGGTASGCTISTDQLSASSAGTCLVTATIAADSLYDTAVSTPATETFTPLGTLIVTAEGGVVSAGSTFHPTSNVSGTVGSDSASVTSVSYTYVGTGSTTYGPSTVAPAAPGTYEVTPSAAVIAVSPVADLGDYNATYTYVGASLTILAPPLVVAAVSTTIDQGQPTGVPIALGGLVNGDSGTITSVTVTYTGTGSTVYGPSSVPPTLPGTYEVTPSAATVSISPPQDAGLYPGTVTYRSATLTIVAVGHLTVAVADLSATAGDTITPSVSVHGLLGSDIASLGAVTVTYVGEGGTVYGPSTTAPSAAGTYLMTPSSATVTITPAADQVQYLQPYAYVAGTLVLAPAPVIVPVKPVVVPKTTHVVIKTFAEGSATLSPALKRQVLALARRVKSGHYLRVELAGYTDNVFTPAFDALLVYQRAQAVATQLRADLAALKAGGVTIVIVPGVTVELVSANSTAAGRAANRKVIATLKAH